MGTKNPYSQGHAVALAQSMVNKPCAVGQCDHQVGVFFGWGHSGEYDAKAHYADIPAAYRVNRPHAGLLAFYRDTHHWHVGLVVPQLDSFALICSDLSTHHYGVPIERPGRIGEVPLDGPTKVWGMPLVGYAEPLFPHGTSPVHSPLYPVPHA